MNKLIKSNYKWEVLALLWIAYLLNQADRQVFNVVLPLIKADLDLSDVQIGSIATIFNLAYALLVPLAGYVGDIFSRKWIVTISIIFWSIATMFTGLSNGVLLLILTRSIATGGGEAFFGPANYSLLAQYHDKTRAFAMSIHQTAYYLGIILSGYIAGYIGEIWGWRSAFYLFGAIGVIHGIVLGFRLKDKKETVMDKKEIVKEKVRFAEGFGIVFRTPTALVLTLCFSGLIFVLTGYLTWMPTYLYENFQMSLSAAGFHSMFYTHLFAFVGILLAGRLSDFFAKKNPSFRMIMQGIGLLIAVPFILLMGKSVTLLVIYIGFAGFGFARAFFDANTYTVLYDVIPSKYHSSASGVMIMIGFAVGSFAPIILGYIKSVLGLSFGISSLAIIWLICGIGMMIAGKYFYLKDHNKKIQYEQQ
ncbi:MFS transporter [Parabacteroides sp. Marseille-P3160]|uniref:MFS transporter n=1 Tax=Parabacteroides sp. Marseille-P3160 TaxID=1917887 RepID=UPI0009BC0155|nr:MFS transporter [Parabacteroides sp. Marseille-P3160]